MTLIYDPVLKTLVETEPDARPVMAGQHRAPTQVLDADIASVSGAADKVLRVQGSPDYLLHLEFASGHDATELPEETHWRATLLGHRHRLLVRSLVVLLRPEADSPGLGGVWQAAFAGQLPHLIFHYQVLRIWQIPAPALLAGGVGTWPLAPIGAVTETELPGMMADMQKRLRRRAYRRVAPELWSAKRIFDGIALSQGND